MADSILFWVILGIVWMVCGILNYGFTFGYFQREFPRLKDKNEVEDRRMAFVFALLGPIGTFAIWGVNGTRHGLKYRDKEDG